MKITLDILKRFHACQPAIDRFAQVFPDGCEDTAESIVTYLEATGADSDFTWAAMLTMNQLDSFHFYLLDTSNAYNDFLNAIHDGTDELGEGDEDKVNEALHNYYVRFAKIFMMFYEQSEDYRKKVFPWLWQ